MYAISLGIIASFFFALTFILNRSMALEGGSWLWSSSLRFWFMAPLLLLLVGLRGSLGQSLRHLRHHALAYLFWSTLGFGLFYAPLTFAAAYAPGWLVAGSWQITIIAGSLLMPWIARHPVPWRGLRWSALILSGIALMLWQQARVLSVNQMLTGFLPVLLAAFMYPLGNRKMLALCGDEVDTLQRVLNMTLASLPFWLFIALGGLITSGAPSKEQMGQAFLVALFSGVIATVLFFAATRRVRDNPQQLAAVEATQSGELLFTLAGEILLLNSVLPSSLAVAGIVLVMLGMCAHSVRAR
nr:multidrug resistance efflux transporter family protein [Pantoea sp. 201603H]